MLLLIYTYSYCLIGLGRFFIFKFNLVTLNKEIENIFTFVYMHVRG